MSADPGVCLAPSPVVAGTVVRIDASGATVVDPDALAEVAAGLRRAATRLSGSAAWVARAHAWRPVGAGLSTATGPWAGGGIASLASAPGVTPDEAADLARRLLRSADDLRDLATRAQSAAQTYAAAETTGVGVANAVGTALGAMPVAAAGLTLLGLATVVGVVSTAPARDAVLPGDGDPVLGWAVRRLPAQLTQDGHAAVLVAGASGLVTGLAPGSSSGRLDVSASARSLLALTPSAGTASATRCDDPPQIPAPRTLADVLGTVARTYDGGKAGADPGNPTGLITVQRLDHPDGSRGWLVAIPGTQSGGFASTTATDMTTNLALVGGVDDDMTAGVLSALEQAGVGADEPVALVGHSQGGMVAASVAAAGAYSVKAVVTAGSPDIAAAVPSGVRVVALVHDEDAIPQLDARGWASSPGTTTISRDLSADLGADPGPSVAHRLSTYLDTATTAQEALGDRDLGLDEVLGPAGTAAVTSQFVVRRESR